MKEFIDPKEDFEYMQDNHKRFDYWIEIPDGAEVLTGLKNDRYSLVFWKPSVGEVWQDGRFAKYGIHKSISFEDYIDRWTLDPVLWKSNDMKEQYVIKTRSDEDEYLAYYSHEDVYYLCDRLQYAEKYKTVEDARNCVDTKVLKGSKYRCDIYKVVQALEFIERGI